MPGLPGLPGLLFLLVMWVTMEPVHSGPKGSKQFLRFFTFDNCPGTEDPYSFFNYTTIKKVNEELYTMEGTMVMSRSIPQLDNVEIMLSRCRGPRNECKYFNTLKMGNKACTIMNARNMLWSEFVSSFNPRIECPLKKGLYTLTNGTFDLSQIRVLNLPTDGRWKVDVRFFVGTKMTCCFFFILSVLNAKPQ